MKTFKRMQIVKMLFFSFCTIIFEYIATFLISNFFNIDEESSRFIFGIFFFLSVAMVSLGPSDLSQLNTSNYYVKDVLLWIPSDKPTEIFVKSILIGSFAFFIIQLLSIL
ncbi:MAG: hypothetical protein ACI35O_11955 [Bacillaceae bacterium]